MRRSSPEIAAPPASEIAQLDDELYRLARGAGRLKILPPGSNPTWLLGRRPIMRVHRRERTLLA
jgi:hypothetical protein